MADHSVGARTESNESQASEALMFCFVLTMLFRESLGSLSIWSLSFALPTRFFVPEGHATEWNLPQQRKCYFFQFSRSPVRENQRDGGKEFTVAEGIV